MWALRRRLSAPLAACGTACALGSSSACQPSMCHHTAIQCSVRCKASSIKIANRRKVEMFVGKRFHLPTRLRTAAPDVAREWNYDKNPMHLYPEIIGIGHMLPVWWTCEACGHDYEMSVEKRVVRGGECPECLARAERQTHLQASTDDARDSTRPHALQDEDLLEGEANTALRPKRPTMLNLRTKY